MTTNVSPPPPPDLTHSPIRRRFLIEWILPPYPRVSSGEILAPVRKDHDKFGEKAQCRHIDIAVDLLSYLPPLRHFVYLSLSPFSEVIALLNQAALSAHLFSLSTLLRRCLTHMVLDVDHPLIPNLPSPYSFYPDARTCRLTLCIHPEKYGTFPHIGPRASETPSLHYRQRIFSFCVGQVYGFQCPD